MFGIKFPAWRWSTVVDSAIHTFADFSSQCHATLLGCIGAEHADNGGGDGNGHFSRYAGAPGEGAAGQFGGVEVDAEAGAAGAAGLADVHGR